MKENLIRLTGKKLIAGVFLGMVVTTFAATSAEQALNQRLSDVKTLKADFKQTVQSQDGSVMQTSSGTLLLKRPGKFIWQVEQPMKQTIVTNGKKVWVYEPDLQQVTIRKLQKSLGKTPILLLTDKNILLQKQFTMAKSHHNGMTVYTLVPKANDQTFNKLIVGFSKGQLKVMRLLNNLGQTTIIQFSNIEKNNKISDKQFEFKAPKGTDIVDTTKT